MKTKRPIISSVLLSLFFFIPLLGGIWLSRKYAFTVSEDVIMCFVISPIEGLIFAAIILLWKHRPVNEYGDDNIAYCTPSGRTG